MGGLRRRRDYERSQFVYGSPAERRQSVVTSALNMDLSNLPSGPSEEDLQQIYQLNPTDYGTPVDYSTPTRPVVETPVEEDYTQPSGMGIWGLMSSMGMFGDTTKQEAPLATYTPVKSSNPYVASIPAYNDTLLDASWFGDGGPIDLGYNSKAYEEWKASLPKNLRKETPEYDLYGAYKAGLKPHLEADGYYHLGSRDPKTNRLLKKPSHSTYPLAILADAQEGYLAGPYDKKTDSVYTYPLPWIKGDGGYLYDDGGDTDVIPNDNIFIAKPIVPIGIQPELTEEAALRRANKVYSNYSEAKDNPLSPLQETIYNVARYAKDNIWEGLPSGVSNCTLSATQWVNPTMPIKNAASIVNNPSQYGYTQISGEDAIPGNLLIAKTPNKDSYHTMMISGFAEKDGTYIFNGKKYRYKKGEPLLTYSAGGHNESFLRKNVPLSVYTENSDGHTENLFYRYNYPNEVFLPEVQIAARRHE